VNAIISSSTSPPLKGTVRRSACAPRYIFPSAFSCPTALAGKASNGMQTLPGKGWVVILRLYGPLEPWFNKIWKPGEIELVK
jgi:hypothetical protein